MSSEEVVSPPLNIEKCSLVLVDVAGTTTSIGFVKDTLFPFFLQRIDAFLQEKWEEEAVKAAVKQLQDGDLDVAAAVTLLKSLTEEDSPNPGLKALQGLVYKEGYAKGELKAHVFDDVKEAFETWAKSRHIAIYSTGSVDSQKMLFTHTVAGDISAHIHKYYDQEIGSKTEAESYKKIVEDAKVELQEVVFITDDVKEATAAKSSGIHAVLIKREGNAAFPEDTSKDFTIISSFNELVLEKASKRRIEEEGAPTEAPPSKVPKTDPAEEKEENAQCEKLEKIEEEMEVDDKTEESKTATEETEKLVENTPEKTDIEIKDVEVENKVTDIEIKDVEVENKVTETTCIDTEMKDEKVVASSEAVVDEPQTAVEETETKTKDEVIETQPATEAKTDEAQSEKKSPETDHAEEKTDEAHVGEKAEESKVEEKTEESKVEEKTEEKPADGKKDESPLQEKPDEPTPVPEESKPEEKTPAAVEVAQPVVEEKAEEVKTGEATQPEESKVEDTKVEANGDVKEEEEAETSTPKVEEKENKSVLANGVENGKKEESEEAPGETVEGKDEEKDEETEVKVKKLEESAESKTVSVEV